MKYNTLLHLPTVVEEIRQEYRKWLQNGNPYNYLNGIEDFKELIRNGKEHSEFLILLTKNEKEYENKVRGVKENLLKNIRNAIENANLDESITNIDHAIKTFDDDLLKEQAQYLEQLKVNIFGYLPHIELENETE